MCRAFPCPHLGPYAVGHFFVLSFDVDQFLKSLLNVL